MMEGPWRQFPKRSTSPVSDVDTVLVDSLKALDPNRPIREADMCGALADVCFVPKADIQQTTCANRKTASRRSLRNPISCFRSGGDRCGLPFPPPPQQTQRAEARGEKRKGSRKRS